VTVIEIRENGGSRSGPGEGEDRCPDVLSTGTYPTSDDQVSIARQSTRVALVAHPRFDAALAVELVSELTTNAIRYSGSQQFDLVITLTPAGFVHVAVSDSGQGPTMPVLREPELTEEGGRGLWLVDRQAARWGVIPHGDGVTVWFELQPCQEAAGVAGGGPNGR
jgi:anti-sigma regulatory factor (Ser/Thr protein kinase)